MTSQLRRRFLLAGRVERVIAVSRVALAGTSLFAIWLDPTEPARHAALTYGLHATYLAYAVGLAALMWRRDSTGPLPFATHALDIVVASVFQYLTLGPSSPFFVYFIFDLFAAALRWGWRATLQTAAVELVAFVGMGVWLTQSLGPTEFELNRFIIRIVYLLVIAALLSYLGRHEAWLRDDFRRLADWPALGADAPPAALARILAHAAGLVGAAEVRVAWEADDEPWRYGAAWPGAPVTLTRHGPDVEAPEAAEAAEASAVATFRTDRLSGRVCFGGMPGDPAPARPVMAVVAREIGQSLEQLRSMERLREVAVGEERIRLARDLHDGVLQSLTGVRLELQTIAATEPGAAPGPRTGDRLLAIERALAIEQRELRTFIEGLKPRRGLPHRGPFVERLDELQRRLALEWSTPVVVRVSPPDLELTGALAREVPLMAHEAVVNALKHGHPSRVVVDVQAVEDALHVTVTDDGRGFGFQGRYDHAALAAANLGPVSLRERVAALGGELAIEARAGASRVEMRLPRSALHV